MRLSTKIVAGGGGELKLFCVSPNQTGRLLLSGFQLEEGELSSYIRNSARATTRQEDNLENEYILPDPNGDWTCSFFHNSLENTNTVKYAFNNGMSGIDEFSAWFVDEYLKVNIGGIVSIFTDAIDSESTALVKSGDTLSLYKDGELHGTLNNSGSVSNIASKIYIGGDETSSNNIDAYLSKFNFWAESFGPDEIKYIAGV